MKFLFRFWPNMCNLFLFLCIFVFTSRYIGILYFINDSYINTASNCNYEIILKVYLGILELLFFSMEKYWQSFWNYKVNFNQDFLCISPRFLPEFCVPQLVVNFSPSRWLVIPVFLYILKSCSEPRISLNSHARTS